MEELTAGAEEAAPPAAGEVEEVETLDAGAVPSPGAQPSQDEVLATVAPDEDVGAAPGEPDAAEYTAGGPEEPDFAAAAVPEALELVLGVRPALVALLVLVYVVGVLLFLAIEPTKPWILLVVTGLVTVGADGILRTHQQGGFEGDIAGTAPFLFLPALFTLGSGLFLEDVAKGYWAVPGIFVSAVLMSWIIYAEHVSVDDQDPLYPVARLILNVGTYLTAFAFFAVVYTFDVSLVPAAVAVGLVTLLLSVEVLREAEADPVRALVYAGVIGLVVAEARWGLYFLPLESYLAAVFLLLVFYMGSGLVQHHLTDDLRPPVVAEFVAIAVLGILIVALGRIFESNGSLTP